MTNTTELRKDKSLGNLIVQHLAEVIKAGNDLSEHIITPEIYLAKTDQIACGLVDKVTGLIEAAEKAAVERAGWPEPSNCEEEGHTIYRVCIFCHQSFD